MRPLRLLASCSGSSDDEGRGQHDGQQSGDAPVELTEVDLERIPTFGPDLSLALSAGLDEGQYEQLSAFAPTIAGLEGDEEFTAPWQESTRVVGRALGRADAADEVEAEPAAVAADHPDYAEATAVAGYDFGGADLGVYLEGDPRAALLAEVGFGVPDAITELPGVEFYAAISPEQSDLIDADAVIWCTIDGASFVGTPVYESLDVAREGRSIVLDELTPLLDAALDGDPATEVPTDA